ncbi:hypothetical protein GTY65_27465 [Streptomyces sp. SID8379]|nr:hypothetical protein [Streptomyces sp. SID8379]
MQILLDIVHVSEYVWATAHSFHRPGTPAAEAWVAGHLTTILHGRAGRAAAEITAQAEPAGLRGAKREAADTCVRYLAGHLDQLCYDTALAEGWPIATGPIEGACRHLIGDRLEITGARWGLCGAEAVLKLRAVKTTVTSTPTSPSISPASTNGSIPPLTSTTTTSRSEPQASPGECYTLRR